MDSTYFKIQCLLFLFAALLKNGFAQQAEGDTCVDRYTNSVGRCTAVNACQSARDDLQYNGIQPTFCSYTYNTAVVCCRDGSSILQTAPPNRRPTQPQRPSWGTVSRPDENGSDASFRRGQNQTKRISERKCEEYSRSVTETIDFISLLPDPDVMSVSAAKCNYDSVRLIVGGQNSELGEFPHMAAIGWPSVRGGYMIKCGGSLISPAFVLTAGHCLHAGRDTDLASAVPTIVRLADQNINPAVDDGANPVEVAIRRIIKHPDYRPPRRYNDLGLLELVSPVELEANLRPACLWTRDDFGGHERAIATGWGVIDVRTSRTSDELQKVSLNLLPNGQCEPLLALLHNRKWQGFAATQLCAGELAGGKDSCQGDSGGPLQVTSAENHCVFYIMGITSFGAQCGEQKRPAVYTRVASYLDWIESVVWPNGV